MKANKFFAVALAALTLVSLVGCSKDKKEEPSTDALTLDQTSLSLEVGKTATLTANLAATWASNNEQVATVVPGNDGGKTALVTAVAEGNAIISATANGETKTCVVLVTKAQGGGGGGEAAAIKGTKIWPVVLDAVTAEKYASMIAGDFRVNDVDNHLYIWASGETYAAGDGTGKNFFGNTEGYVSLTVVAPAGWSGGGFCIENAEAVTAMGELKAAIVANPDKYFLHIGIKAANEGNHEFYTFGTDATAFNIGKAAIEKGAVIGDFERDGEWHEFDVPMAQFATAIASAEVKSGTNILCFLSGATAGAQLNIDAVYFYEK